MMKKYGIFWGIYIIVLLTLFVTNADANNVSITTYQKGNGIEIEINLNSNPEMQKQIIDGYEFIHIYVEGMGVSGTIGNPELPVWRRYIEVPLDVSDVYLTYKEVTPPDEMKIQHPIYPVQYPWEKIQGVQRPKLVINNDVYNGNDKLGEKVVAIEPLGNVRGRNLYQISYYPICYVPKNSKIYIRKNIVVDIQWKLPKSYTLFRDKKYSSKYIDDLWEPYIINSSLLDEKSKSINYDIPLGMLVIVASPFVGNSTLNEWVKWKTQRGFVTIVENVANIGTNFTAIKNYIRQAYLNWEIPPSFVVLVGDANYIQAPAGSAYNNPITDLYYSTVDGDEYYTPDLWVGRIAVSDSNQLNNALNKILKYEKVEWPLIEPWYIKASFLTGLDHYETTEGTHNYVISNYFDPAEFNSQKLYTVSYGATTTDVISAINSGRGWVIYSGHGSYDSWADGPPFSQSNINFLTNTVYPWVLSFACDTGQYARPECFGETWQRATGGGVGFLGSSVTSYWDEDDILEKFIIESFFTSGKTWTAGMILNGKLKFFNYYGNTDKTKRYFEMYNLLGDPSTEIWAGILQNPAITHDSSVNPNGLPFSTYIEWEKAVISLSNSNILLGATLSQFGKNLVTFSPPGTVPIVKLTITGNPVIPYQVDLPVIAGANGNIQWDKTIYNGSSLAILVLADSNLSGQGEIVIPITSTSGDSEQIILSETQVAGFFEGTIQLTTLFPQNNDGFLSVVHSGSIIAEYYDELTESGTPQTIRAEATIDTNPPQLLQLSITPDIRTADIQLETNEVCSARFEYGTHCFIPFEKFENSFVMNMNHKFLIAGLAPETDYMYRIILTDVAGNEYSTDCDYFTTLHQPDYFTYYYTSDVVETVPLSNHRIIFIPDESEDGYSVCIKNVEQFPRSTKEATFLTLGDDSFAMVEFPLGTYVYLYGVEYSQCFVGSNGYITFTQGNDDYSESLERHFSMPRISLMFDDLDPTKGGTISYQFDTDAFVVTFSGVPRYGSGEANIQLEMFYNGEISITWLNCVSSGFIAGLSKGEGIPLNFELSDFLNYGECYIFYHSADINMDKKINMSELLRIIQFFSMGGYSCDPQQKSEDGYLPGSVGKYDCQPHSSDYNPQDWVISFPELLRAIQIFNMGIYFPCPGESEDNFCF